MNQKRTNLRDEVTALSDSAQETAEVLGRIAAEEARLAASAVVDDSRKVNEVAESAIQAFRDRLDDPRLPEVASQLDDRLIHSAETSLETMSRLSNELRNTVGLVSRIRSDFPLAATPELDTLDEAIRGLAPLIR